MNEALAEYSKELQKLDLEQTEETVRIYREFSEKLYTFASEKEPNDYLIGFIKENDIDFPYEGDFDEFMPNKCRRCYEYTEIRFLNNQVNYENK